MKIQLCLGVVLFFSCNCGEYDKHIRIADFSSERWKMDSLGCMGERREIAHFLEDSIDSIIGSNRDELIHFLGFPSYTYSHMGDSMYAYFTAPGAQCYEKYWREKKMTEAEQIIFFVNNEGKVRATTGVIYP